MDRGHKARFRHARGVAEGRSIYPMSTPIEAAAISPTYVVAFEVPRSRRATAVRIERYGRDDAAALEAMYPGKVLRNLDGDPYVILMSPAEEAPVSLFSSRRGARGGP